MTELTMEGRCFSGLDAIDFFERLPDYIPEELKTEKFCLDYEYALNRLRVEVRASAPIQPKVYKRRFTSYSCGACGHGLTWGQKFCSNCGRTADWYALNTGQERKIGESDGTTD